MKISYSHKAYILITAILNLSGFSVLYAQNIKADDERDRKVLALLKGGEIEHYLNVPESDGQLLHDIIIRNGYKNALEIGTSTGISSIWIAWALSKTGGKLITIEIDEGRHKIALKNFQEAGLSEYIEAKLGNAHEIVHELEGPFDFIFSDADKDWYKNYFVALDPKLKLNGCYTSHNVSDRAGSGWQGAYLKFLKTLPNYDTTVDNNGAGMSISYKRTMK
jgi:predicted O-methyltransferase YrrM